MKKWLASVLLVCLVTGSFYSEASVSPAFGATKAVKRDSQTTKHQKPVHELIVFNDYQVAGLSEEGWNWVKNDEFILPPDTPLDIDLIQTTFGSGTNMNKKEVYLDGVLMPEFSSVTADNQTSFRWEVPRFTIPAAQLSAGVHTLSFVVSDAVDTKSTVHVRFRVEAYNFPFIYPGEQAAGASIPTGATESLFGQYGSKVYTSNKSGTWKLVKKSSNSEVNHFTGQVFSTGVLLAGDYGLTFIPDDANLSPWQITIQVGLPSLYLGTDSNGQKLSDRQKISAESVPGTIQLFSSASGRWWVDGTGQTLSGSQHIDVAIPESLKGMTISVTFEPDQDEGTERASRSATSIQIQIPGDSQSCDVSSARTTLDVLVQNNKSSSLQEERSNLYSSDATVKIYQNPIHKVWVATASDHFRFGSGSAEEGPGVWAVNNVVVDTSYLNGDHTGLELSRYKTGRHKINYYSKANPELSWCGYIEIIEDTPPTASTQSCEVGDKGTVPTLTPMKLRTKDGKEYANGDKMVVNSPDELEELQLSATHVINKGLKKIRRDKGKKDNRFLYITNLQWEYGAVPYGAMFDFGDGEISAKNELVVKYNGEVIKAYKPRKSEDYEPGGYDSLDLGRLIEQDGRTGEYTVEVENTLTYRTCIIVERYSAYKKKIDDEKIVQRLVFTVEVK
ncbi:hypothetical protein EDM52_04135 [Brevibacillus invocatus]|uniref:Uncharacterized protein n=1 Tax=Brevibacillus invocatus TaxID=173959 RepID=A0A3M8CK37_9BACL|nr:hypothetical protein [Brevibacillus invocatus]RNB76112.1 hypothetical protein EDM52_04135 [Brevibacillus invocatus]